MKEQLLWMRALDAGAARAKAESKELTSQLSRISESSFGLLQRDSIISTASAPTLSLPYESHTVNIHSPRALQLSVSAPDLRVDLPSNLFDGIIYVSPRNRGGIQVHSIIHGT